MGIIKYQRNPFLSPFAQDLEKFLDLTWRNGASNQDSDADPSGIWTPKVDVKEDANNFVIHADIPGVDPKNIQVSFEKNTLTIQGERNVEKKEDKDNYHREERFSGTFYRQFTLPANVDEDNISAVSKHGVLVMTIPKIEKSTSKQIDVKIEE